MRKKQVNKKKKATKSPSRKKKSTSGGRAKQRRLWLPAGQEFRCPFEINSLKLEVAKDLQWILPFLERTHRFLPRLQMPVRINSYKPGLKRRLRTLGTTYYDDGIINLSTHEQILKRQAGKKTEILGVRRLPKRKVLETLAHELAHLHVVDHNFEHQELTLTIFRSFGLKKTCVQCGGQGQVDDKDCNPH